MTATNQTRADAIRMVAEVLRDGGRSDRYLRRADDGHYYTSPDRTFMTNDGPDSPISEYLPVAEGVSDDDVDEWAADLLRSLDNQMDA